VTNRRRSLRKGAGISLVELLAVFGVMVLILPAVGLAFVTGLNYRQRSEAATADAVADFQFEETIRRLLAGAFLSADINDESTYFILEQSSGSVNDLGYSLVFSTIADSFKNAALESQDDFQTLNENYGPQGGVQEVSLSLTPVGQVGNEQGLFLRRQRPPDSDYTQGGRESLLDSDIQSIQFECFDGEAWQTTWNTLTDVRRLPAAVRVTYVLRQDPDVQRQFVVRLRLSDVTPDNPATQTSGATAP
jgi:type II secretory pathway pseudopilin PulG